MNVTCQELRNRAWNSLTGKYWAIVLMILIFSLISGAASSVTAGVLSLLTLPIGYAVSVAILNVSRTQADPQIESLFTVYRDNFLKAFLVPFLQGLFILLWSLLLIIPGIIMAYAYSMAIYVANDNPELSAMDAIRKSRELMDGHKWDLFVLDLSFIGWILLCLLTCGIGFIFLAPYMEMAHVEFYRELVDKQVEEAQVVSE